MILREVPLEIRYYEKFRWRYAQKCLDSALKMGLKSLEIRLKLLEIARREIFSSCGVNLATKVGFKRDKTFRRVVF